jgi:hypothetical protein
MRKFFIFVPLLAASLLWAQMPADSGAPAGIPSPSQGAAATPPDPALTGLLAELQTLARQSDHDLAALRIEKWKADAATKQQAQGNAAAIHRNLANAVPELLQHVQEHPGSLAANFKLYRDLNALYEAFSALVESAGAFGPTEQYSPLAGDIARFDQLRHQCAERLDQMSGTNDAEVIQLRAQIAAASAKSTVKTVAPSSKIVVDDNHPRPAAKKKPKKPSVPAHSTTPPPS